MASKTKAKGSFQVRWYGGPYQRAVRTALKAGIKAVAAEQEVKIKEKIKTQGPPRSLPGDPPHKDSGNLYDSIGHDADLTRLLGWVYSTVSYWKVLEYGTQTTAARPFLRNTMIENVSHFRDVMITTAKMSLAAHGKISGHFRA